MSSNWWPFKRSGLKNGSTKTKVEQEAEERLSDAEAVVECHLDWEDDEEVTASIKQAADEAMETAQAAKETLTRSTKDLREASKKTHQTLTDSLKFSPEELKQLEAMKG